MNVLSKFQKSTMFHLLLGSLHKIDPCELWTNASHYLDITTCLLTYNYVLIMPRNNLILRAFHLCRNWIWKQQSKTNPFLRIVIVIVEVLGAIGAWWNVMPTTPHMFPKAHGTQLVGSRSSTFILGFRVGCKQVINNTCQNFAGVHHGTQKKLNEHQIYLFQNGAQNSMYLWL